MFHFYRAFLLEHPKFCSGSILSTDLTLMQQTRGRRRTLAWPSSTSRRATIPPAIGAYFCIAIGCRRGVQRRVRVVFIAAAHKAMAKAVRCP